MSLLCLPLHFSGSQVIEYHWVTEQNFVSRRAVNTKYKYHTSWNLTVPFSVPLILRTYPRPINVKGSDKHQPPGQAGSVRCRGAAAPAPLRYASPPEPPFGWNDLECTRFLVLGTGFPVLASFQVIASRLLASSLHVLGCLIPASTSQHPCSTLPRNLPYLLPLPWKPRKSTVSNNTSRICAILPNIAFTAYRCLDCLHL